ncbi:MAG: hypothetical protein GC160_25460 [Acidobacteria bacterium]|nr:hypothetical protein [Acidobacteriota bacterium]
MAKLRIARRALAESAFTVFVLGPLIVGGFWWVLEPTLTRAAGWTRAAAAELSAMDLTAVGLALVAALLAAGLPSALRETFSIRTPDAALDSLPVAPGWRFVLLALTQAARNAPVFFAIWLGFGLLAEVSGGIAPSPALLGLALLETAFLQIVGGMVALRVGLFASGRLLAAGAGLLGLAAAVRSYPAALWASAPLAPLATYFGNLLGDALGRSAGPVGGLGGWPAQAGTALAALALAAALYARWREEDRERAEQALSQRRRLLAGLERRIPPRFGRPAAALFVRDLRLTLRGFAPSTTVSIALAALFVTGGFLSGQRLEEAWRAPAAQIGVSLACLSLSALAPLLLVRQLPFHWLELSSGAAPEALWTAKNLLALAVSAPAAAIGLALGPTLGLQGADLAIFAARLGLCWLTVGTMIGLLSFEIAASPILGLLLGGLVSMALCAFYALPEHWPIGVFLYAYLMHALKERAEQTTARLGAQE